MNGCNTFYPFYLFELCDVTGRVDLVQSFGFAPDSTDVLLGPTGVDHRQVGAATSSTVQRRKKLLFKRHADIRTLGD